MKTAIYRRPTSADQAHAVDVVLGEGDTRTLSIHGAQHLYELLGMKLNISLLLISVSLGEGDIRIISPITAKRLFRALEVELQHYLDFVNGGSGK